MMPRRISRVPPRSENEGAFCYGAVATEAGDAGGNTLAFSSGGAQCAMVVFCASPVAAVAAGAKHLAALGVG